jgi:hypothetical protein
MRLNHKALKLVELGLSSKTVSKLTEGQINILHKRLVNEEVTTDIVTSIPTGQSVEKEVQPGGKVKVSSSGTTITTRSKEIGESKKKKPNPYAICTTTLGKEFGTTKRSEWTKSQEKKYERCKAKIDESLKEGKNPVSLFLEQQIEKIVEKHMPPKMTKKEIINYLIEAPADAPVKEPKTKPTTKPGTRPSNPNKNPFPKEHPAPKAKLPEPEEAKDTILDLIMNLIKKNEK